MAKDVYLYGRMFITGNIEVCTGLHIGGSGGAFAIGAVDKPVITDPLTGQPYIPGSSLRGKMRSLTEKYEGRVRGQRIAQGEIHACTSAEEYNQCAICNTYGVAATDFSLPTRLIVRDVPLNPESTKRLRTARTELPYTEVKTEVSIDRVTSQANPRQLERVPAGAVFGPMELVFSFYQPEDINLLPVVADGLALLEDDYLGGHGARGSGKVIFTQLRLALKRSRDYRNVIEWEAFPRVSDLAGQMPEIKSYLQQQLFGG